LAKAMSKKCRRGCWLMGKLLVRSRRAGLSGWGCFEWVMVWRMDCLLHCTWDTYIFWEYPQFSIVGGMRCDDLQEDDKHSMYHRIHHTTWKVTPLRKSHHRGKHKQLHMPQHSANRPANHITVSNASRQVTPENDRSWKSWNCYHRVARSRSQSN
jgi:hypothetical protein